MNYFQSVWSFSGLSPRKFLETWGGVNPSIFSNDKKPLVGAGRIQPAQLFHIRPQFHIVVTFPRATGGEFRLTRIPCRFQFFMVAGPHMVGKPLHGSGIGIPPHKTNASNGVPIFFQHGIETFFVQHAPYIFQKM